MIYVALLRGINVGGKNKIDMKVLKQTFEKAGMKSVVTYLHTGNVVFVCDDLQLMEITNILEKVIYEDFGLEIKIVVRSLDDFKIIIDALPALWKNDKHMKSDVLFLWDEIDNKVLLDELAIKPEIDNVKYVAGAILWSVDRENVTKSGMIKLVGTDLYKKMTIRNVNTTRKIYKLMDDAGSNDERNL